MQEVYASWRFIFNGEKCNMLLIQDVTAFHMVDKEIKDNLSMIQTNMCISNQLKRPLKTVGEISKNLIDKIKKMEQFPKKSAFLNHLRAILSCSLTVLQSVSDL
jgi:hypothetical protein